MKFFTVKVTNADQYFTNLKEDTFQTEADAEAYAQQLRHDLINAEYGGDFDKYSADEHAADFYVESFESAEN